MNAITHQAVKMPMKDSVTEYQRMLADAAAIAKRGNWKMGGVPPSMAPIKPVKRDYRKGISPAERGRRTKVLFLRALMVGLCDGITIATFVGCNNSTIHHNANILKDAGHITVTASRGRTRATYAITDAGRAWLAEHGVAQ